MIDSVKYILAHPHENGFTTFVLGILFVLSVYHFLLYFQHRDKVYLFYSLYTFLIFLNNLIDSTAGFVSLLIKPIAETLHFLDLPLMWLYNIIYFVFGFTFINLKSYSKKWYSIIFKTIKYLLILVLLIAILSLLTANKSYLITFGSFIVPFFLLFGIICYYPLFTIKMPLKNYIIYGSFVLFISSLIAYYIPQTNFISSKNDLGFTIFYAGVIIENIIFSLGLGAKQKLILQEKNDSQKKLIIQLKENEKLKMKIQKQLEKDVASYSKQAEKDKFEKLKVEYDKELVELKMSSLRSQMNPHFIFNSLNAIKLYIIDNDKENAVYYLNKFSKLIRKILSITREKEISLAEEIETVKLYLDIENIRFQNEIDISFTIDKKLSIDTIKIPSLILQPFIENAIWHGLSLKKGAKKISLAFIKEKDTHFKISIEDNGIGREKSAEIQQRKIHKKESLGIKLTKERLRNFTKDYKNNYLITFIDLKDAKNNAIGTTVILKMPLY